MGAPRPLRLAPPPLGRRKRYYHLEFPSARNSPIRVYAVDVDDNHLLLAAWQDFCLQPLQSLLRRRSRMCSNSALSASPTDMPGRYTGSGSSTGVVSQVLPRDDAARRERHRANLAVLAGFSNTPPLLV